MEFSVLMWYQKPSTTIWSRHFLKDRPKGQFLPRGRHSVTLSTTQISSTNLNVLLLSSHFGCFFQPPVQHRTQHTAILLCLHSRRAHYHSPSFSQTDKLHKVSIPCKIHTIRLLFGDGLLAVAENSIRTGALVVVLSHRGAPLRLPLKNGTSMV